MSSIYATALGTYGFKYDIYDICIFKINLSNLGNYNKSLSFNYDIDYLVVNNQVGAPEFIEITPSYKLLFTNTNYAFNNNNNQIIFDNSSWVDKSNYSSFSMPKDIFFSCSYISSCSTFNFNIDSNFNYAYLCIVHSEDYFSYNDSYTTQFLCNDTTITSLSDSYQNGYNQGNNFGYTNGYNEGYYQGNTEGYDSGYRVGYDNGYSVGFNEDNNFTKLFISIGETPVNTFKQILNFDILGVNVAQFVLSLFTLFIVIAGIKKLL